MFILRIIKIAFLCLVALALVLLLFSNNEMITVRFLPDNLAEVLQVQNAYTVPLNLFVPAILVLGIVVGFVWEWLREYRYRSEARVQRREATRLSNEVAQMKGTSGDNQNDILAIVDNAAR